MPSSFEIVKTLVNTARRAIDAQVITFHEKRPNGYQVLEPMVSVEIAKASDSEVQHFLTEKAYRLGFRAASAPRQIWVPDSWDAEYIGTSTKALCLAAHVLEARKLVKLDESAVYARPSEKLISEGPTSPDGAPAARRPISLASLPPKPKFEEDLARELKSHTDHALIFIDLDNFKSVNDTQGHAAGDVCLNRVVQVIGRVVGQKGSMYRWGGDEFVVTLPDFSTEEAAVTAERIRRSIHEAKPGNSTLVTASIGVCGADRAEEKTPTGMLKAADAAAYASKNAGKNRVTTWPLKAD
jgi:diguanylate cyclase (GGDEF)-like protein